MCAAAAASFCVHWSLARILNAQAGGDDQHFVRGVLLLRLQQHAAQRGIDRQARKIFAQRRQLPGLVQRAQLLQQSVPAVDGRRRRRIHKRKRLDGAEPERFHAQNDFSQIRALNFGLRVRGAFVEIFFRIQADADAVLDAAGAALALICAALRDLLNRQPLGARARIVAAHARQPGIHDVADARNGERGFGDVRGHDDFPPVGRAKTRCCSPALNMPKAE